jgi:hypothetical protein
LITYYVLFFIHLGSRKVHIAGVTPHPDQTWMTQMARNMTLADWGFLCQGLGEHGKPFLRVPRLPIGLDQQGKIPRPRYLRPRGSKSGEPVRVTRHRGGGTGASMRRQREPRERVGRVAAVLR